MSAKQTLLTFFLGFSTLATCAQKQTLTEAKPETAGFSASKLNRIDSMVHSYIDSGFIGGATALVARNGKIVYYKGLGEDNILTHEAMKRDEIFRIASQTKAVACVAILILADEGKLKLSDPVSKFIDTYKNQVVLDSFNKTDNSYTTVPAKREVTIHDLLTHTSGIGYAQIGSPEAVAIYATKNIPGGIGIGNITLGEKMREMGKLPLMHQPGTQWTYGLNMDLMGYLVEVISGKPLDVFLRTRIFEPLGMHDTWFYLPENKYARLVSLNTEDSTGHVIPAPDSTNLNGWVYNNYPATKGTYFSGGGGLSSTAYDYALFMQMLLNRGSYNGKQILKPATVDSMSVNQIGNIPYGDMLFGLGFGVYTKASKARSPLSPGSYGWGGMFSSSYWIDPKEKIVAQFFLNQFPNTHADIHEKFQQLVYDALVK
ncbi:MAG: class A beta-lactamase-related serine hydrolase [Chitinophagaceae bacterium]|nr:MAG: class A beta-lactamase-related serine hydrolase [Chitinophagaceae bacterium]